jgi:hypothetical protein
VATVLDLPSEVHAVLAGFVTCELATLARDGDAARLARRPPAAARARAGAADDHDRLGPASLLCHGHDLGLARLRSFAVRGRLLVDATDWIFHPTGMISGLGLSGPAGDLRVFLAARRRAGRYLAARGLPRPRVPWRRVRSSS